jgi:KDO2-lipid IV(A) lauroyltransferase
MLILLRWMSRRSLRFLHAVGAVLGWLTYALSPSYRRRHRANAALAGVTPGQRRASVAEAGKLVLETPRLWLRAPTQPIADPLHWEGDRIIEQCLAERRGLVLLTPHLGSFEVCAQGYAQRFGAVQPITVLFRPARFRVLRELQQTSRARPALATAPATLGGVRQMLRALRRGETIGLLPDQVPPDGLGVWADFFGRPAYTMTLAARLALQSGAPIVLIWCERLAGGAGFKVRLQRLAEPLPTVAADGDALQIAQAQAVNRAMQQLIEQCPQQYLWGYNRYKQPRPMPESALASTAVQP